MDLITLFFLFISIIFAIVIHEFSHGYVAYKLGDPTAKQSGRLTLNPLSHLDPMGTLVLIITGLAGRPFGWAKPIPVNPYYFKNMYKDIAKVGLAGPLANIIFAYILSGLYRFGIITSVSSLFPIIDWIVQVNIGLAIFNLIPIPPLDGSRILIGILPEDKVQKYMEIERYGFFILIFILLFGQDLLMYTLYPIWDFLYNLFMNNIAV